jgi:hypothetical protein
MGLNSCMNICWLTPAAMNSDTPEPKPYLLTISSISIMNKPPRVICATSISGLIPASGVSPPSSTKMNASITTNAIASSFCIPWNLLFPSCFVRSMFIIPAPFSNCNIIDAVTIGPIPSVIRLPKACS